MPRGELAIDEPNKVRAHKPNLKQLNLAELSWRPKKKMLDNWKTILGASAILIAAGLWLGSLQTRLNSLNPNAIKIAQEEAIEQIRQAGLDAGLAPSGSSGMIAQAPPAGTIIPFGGPVGTEAQERLLAAGWLLCDGSAVSRTEFPNLFEAIGNSWGNPGPTTFNLPNLAGRFLRGVSRDSSLDPDADRRAEASPGGNTGNAVGSVQSDATRMPNEIFRVAGAGEHSHAYTSALVGDCPGHECGGGTAKEYPKQNGASTTSVGNHSHEIQGGDSETRPTNAYVNYLIKF